MSGKNTNKQPQNEIAQLNDVLREHFTKTVTAVKIRFDEPDPDNLPTLPTFHLFLYLIHEDLDIRQSSGRQYNAASGEFVEDPAYIRCLYLITYWGPKSKGSYDSPDAAANSDLVLNINNMIRSLLTLRKSAAFRPYQLRIIEPEALNSLGNFWQALDNKPRTIINFAVTLPVDINLPAETAPPVYKIATDMVPLNGVGQLALEQQLFALLQQQMKPGELARVTLHVEASSLTTVKKKQPGKQPIRITLRGLAFEDVARRIGTQIAQWKTAGLPDEFASRWVVVAVDADALQRIERPEFVLAGQQLPAFSEEHKGKNRNLGKTLDISNDGKMLIVSGFETPDPLFFYQYINGRWQEKYASLISSNFDGGCVRISGNGEVAAIGIRNEPFSSRGSVKLSPAGKPWTPYPDGWTIIKSEDNFVKQRFGDVIALSADAKTLVIWAQKSDISKEMDGAVYVTYLADESWSALQKIELPDKADGDNFGSALSVNYNGNIFFAGAPGRNNSVGLVVGYQRNNEHIWQKTVELSPPDTGSKFGASLGMNEAGTLLAVSGTTANDDGAVYLFSRQQDGWQLVQTITLPAETAPGFGYDVALSGDGGTLCVSSPTATNAESAVTGSVWIYKNPAGEWQLRQQLFAADGAAGHRYGEAIAVNHAGTLLAVGAPDAPGAAAGKTGKVWLYEA